MRISRLVSVLAAVSFLIASATARADVAPLPTGGNTSVSTSGGSSSTAAGASSTAAAGNSAVPDTAPKGDDGGCSIGKSHRASGIALGVLGVALAFGLRRVQRRK